MRSASSALAQAIIEWFGKVRKPIRVRLARLALAAMGSIPVRFQDVTFVECEAAR